MTTAQSPTRATLVPYSYSLLRISCSIFALYSPKSVRPPTPPYLWKSFLAILFLVTYIISIACIFAMLTNQ